MQVCRIRVMKTVAKGVDAFRRGVGDAKLVFARSSQVPFCTLTLADALKIAGGTSDSLDTALEIMTSFTGMSTVHATPRRKSRPAAGRVTTVGDTPPVMFKDTCSCRNTGTERDRI